MAYRNPAMEQARNPTAALEPPPQEYAAFAVPSLQEGAPYIDEPSWAPRFSRPSTQEYPSAQRLQTFPRVDMVAEPSRPPQEYYRKRDLDDRTRHSVEDQDADGFTIQKGQKAIAPDPRRNPPEEPRRTLSMSPRSYTFTRPFDQLNRNYGDTVVGTARQLNGMHFSMADHRRDYPILGMAPPNRARRNTFRLPPAPWDTNLVDLPPETELPNVRVRSVDVPMSGNRSYRL